MKKILWIGAIVTIVLILIIVIIYTTFFKTKQVNFLTEFVEKQGECSPGNMIVSCKTYAIFVYNYKEYNVSLGNNGYVKELCDELASDAETCTPYQAIDSIILVDGKIRIKGSYDPLRNILYNYSISNTN